MFELVLVVLLAFVVVIGSPTPTPKTVKQRQTRVLRDQDV